MKLIKFPEGIDFLISQRENSPQDFTRQIDEVFADKLLSPENRNIKKSISFALFKIMLKVSEM